VVLVLGLRRSRPLVLPAVVVGAVFAAAGVAVVRLGCDLAVALSCAMTFVVLVGDVYPWLALGLTHTDVDPLLTVDDVTVEPAAIDLERVRADARMAHEILVGVSATVGALVVLVAPMAVSSGVAGSVMAVMCCLLVMLRTRRHRSATEVLVGVSSGVLGLGAVAAALIWLHPACRPMTAVTSVGGGAAVLAMNLLAPRSVRRSRLADLAENLSLVSLLPLLAVVTGLFGAARGAS
jgi:hypothetical protein